MSIVDAAVGELAREQNGIVTRPQLEALGLASESIAGRLKNGQLIRVDPRVYTVIEAPPSFLRDAYAALLSHTGSARSALGRGVVGSVRFLHRCGENAGEPVVDARSRAPQHDRRY